MISLSAARSLLKPQNSSVLASRFGHEGPAFLVYDFKKGREVVGFGVNGEECYADHPIFPYPAIRYKRIEGPLIALKEKEKGDWKLLSKDEVKTLYRASFGQTFVEMENQNTGRWRQIVSQVLFGCSLSLFIFWLMDQYIPRELPETLSLEHRQKMLKAMIDARMEGITGISSKWDYEKNDWKK